MRAIIQRVLSAGVDVGGQNVSRINRGLLVLVGINTKDTIEDAKFISRKLLNLRIFENDSGKAWDQNVMQKNYEVLLVSQFTLYGVLKGNKPDFHLAMKSEQSKALYEEFVKLTREAYKPEAIKDGLFGAHMQVNLVNDGPVTLVLESTKDENIID